MRLVYIQLIRFLTGWFFIPFTNKLMFIYLLFYLIFYLLFITFLLSNLFVFSHPINLALYHIIIIYVFRWFVTSFIYTFLYLSNVLLNLFHVHFYLLTTSITKSYLLFSITKSYLLLFIYYLLFSITKSYFNLFFLFELINYTTWLLDLIKIKIMNLVYSWLGFITNWLLGWIN